MNLLSEHLTHLDTNHRMLQLWRDILSTLVWGILLLLLKNYASPDRIHWLGAGMNLLTQRFRETRPTTLLSLAKRSNQLVTGASEVHGVKTRCEGFAL